MMLRSRTTRLAVVFAMARLAGLVACGPGEEASSDESDAGAGVLQVTAKDFEFEAPRETPSGWTTVRLENAGEQDHFVYIYRLPEGVTFEQYTKEVPRVFSRVWDRYSSGELNQEETMQALGEQLPDYFPSEITAAGGVALLDAGRTATSTIHLEPGTYAMECYVKTPEGTWHTDRGMIKRLMVTDDSTGATPPEADVTLTLSNYEISQDGSFSQGENTVAVEVTDLPEGLMPHDINLVRLDDDTTIEEVVSWMNWLDLDQFRSPAPGTNLGGMESMLPGRTGYFTANLEPGRYALVSEGYGARGMVKEFTIGQGAAEDSPAEEGAGQ